MLRVLIFLLGLAFAGLGVTWLIERPGDVIMTWQGYRIETSVGVGLAIVLVSAVALALLFVLARGLLRLPGAVARHGAARKQAKGHAALSRGMIAVGAGDARQARKFAGEAGRFLAKDPLALLLAAQAAQLSSDRAGAIAAFEKLARDPATRLLGLRGLYVEAQRRRDYEAAHYYAHEAHKIAPLPWSAKAVLDYRAAHGQWAQALAALESTIAAKLIDKTTGARQQAVLETAIALEKAEEAPDEAVHLARQALAHAPDFVPATALAARLLSRKGEIRKAARLLEAAWPRQRHPELAEAYLDLRPGDSNADRLVKAQTLARLAPFAPESHMIVARAALAAHDYEAARKAMAPLIAEGERPTARMCMIMAELEDAEGDKGQVRAWLARSARAPRDAAWIADGVAAQRWAPVSPVTGRLDAFVWQKPPERLGAELGTELGATETKDWSLPAPPAQAPQPEPPAESEAPPPAEPSAPKEIEAVAQPPVSHPPAAQASAVQASAVHEPAAADVGAPAPTVPLHASSRSAPAAPSAAPRLGNLSRPQGPPRSAQKVVFPMAGPPDDPGPDAPTEDRPENRRIGLM